MSAVRRHCAAVQCRAVQHCDTYALTRDKHVRLLLQHVYHEEEREVELLAPATRKRFVVRMGL